VRDVAEQRHLAQEVAAGESPEHPLAFRGPSADLDLALVNEIRLTPSGVSLAEDHLSGSEAPGL
jgi:hypothetical protein